MKKLALIVSNPGSVGAENYCEGVVVDVERYDSFLRSPLGGTWFDEEIIKMNRPSLSDLQTTLFLMKDLDYSLIIFTGHGFFNPIKNSTELELQETVTYDASNFRTGKKRTIILDCCRVVAQMTPANRFFRKAINDSTEKLDPMKCRQAYENHIKQCDNELIVGFACDKGERAYDDSANGGFYSVVYEKVRKLGEKISLKIRYMILRKSIERQHI